MATVPVMLGGAALGLAGAAGLYAVLIGALLTPTLQRFALYAHKFNTLFMGDDLCHPEEFGFAKNQVTPFNIRTPDGETLYAWHILPADVYAQHEDTLRKEERPHGPVRDFTKTQAFKLLTSEDSTPANVVVAFHGNAGHIAQGWRPDTYRYMAAQSNTHVVTIDYRGFGNSTGSPTETGLITDGTALVNWVLHEAHIPPARVVILGQSLGTAVASAVSLRFADPLNSLLPPPVSTEPESPLNEKGSPMATTFAGVVLVAPFSSVPSLLLTYRLFGRIPLLAPLHLVPGLAKRVAALAVDRWHTADRLAAYYHVLAGSGKLQHTGGGAKRTMASLQVIHALSDREISYHQTELICQRILGKRDGQGKIHPTEECIDGSHGPALVDIKRDGWPRLRFQLVQYGGHNRIITYTPASAAVVRAMNDLFD